MMGEGKWKLPRRDFVRAMIGVPVLGAFTLGMSGTRADAGSRCLQNAGLHLDFEPPPPLGPLDGEPIRVGFIGAGRRGRELLRCCLQEQLNVTVAGVCDVFDVRAYDAIAYAAKHGIRPRRFRHYHELLTRSDVDAVVIATPDHWHGTMALDAAAAGKHIYVERRMAHRVGETYRLYSAVKQAGVVFQVGHQNRQTQSAWVARSIVRRRLLGPIPLVQISAISHDGIFSWNGLDALEISPGNLDWRQFLGNAGANAFSPERYFHWRKWWDYGTGIAGDLFVQDFDYLNAALDMGIPSQVAASGGIYRHRDGREVPDVMQATLKYPPLRNATTENAGGLTIVHNAMPGNTADRRIQLMGQDASLEIDRGLRVVADENSSRYRSVAGEPIYTSAPGLDQTPAADGRLPTSRDGKIVDAGVLHLTEWLSCIRNGGSPSGGVEQGFEAAMASHMVAIAYRLGRKVEWDSANRRLRGVTPRELESIRMA